MPDKPTIKDIERLIEEAAEAREAAPGDDVEIVFRDTVVGTEWSPDGDRRADELDRGETETETIRFTRDSNGNWVSDSE